MSRFSHTPDSCVLPLFALQAALSRLAGLCSEKCVIYKAIFHVIIVYSYDCTFDYARSRNFQRVPLIVAKT